MFVAKRILALAPHGDDVEFGAGAFLNRLGEQGAQIHTAVFSLARDSLPEGFDADTFTSEILSAGRVLGIDEGNIHIMDFPVRRLPEYRQSVLDALIRLGRLIDPDMILVHASTDVHQDHHTVYEEAVRAFKRKTILGYLVPWNNLSVDARLVVPLDERHLETKINALSQYRSQMHRPYATEDFIRAWAITCGISVSVRYAEMFEVIRWVWS